MVSRFKSNDGTSDRIRITLEDEESEFGVEIGEIFWRWKIGRGLD
jgi:hypothetical protein